MKKKSLQFIAILLLSLLGSRNAVATDVSTLAEVVAASGDVSLVVNSSDNYKLQVLYVSSGDEGYLWDGTAGLCINNISTYLPDVLSGTIVTGGTLNFSKSFYLGTILNSVSNLSLGEVEEPYSPMETTSPDNSMRDYFLKIPGTISENGFKVTTADGNEIYLNAGLLPDVDLTANAGKTGYVTGIYSIYGLRVYPTAYFNENGGTDPNRIDTYAKLKNITEDGLQTFYIPENSRVSFARENGEWQSCVYLWDGNDGVYLQGNDVYTKIFASGANTIQQGQSVTGDITAYYFGTTNYLYYCDLYYPGCSDNLTFGEVGEVTPLTVTMKEVFDNKATKKYDYSYLRIRGTLLSGDTFVDENGNSLTVNTYFVSDNFSLADSVGHVGYLTGIYDKTYNSWNDSYSMTLRAISENCFEDEGLAPATPVTYDASAANEISDIAFADVTITNLNLKGGKYNPICLPFDLNESEVKALFGEDVKVYSFQGYDATSEADTLFLRSTKAMYHANNYIIKPAADINQIFAERVTVKADEPYLSTIWKSNWESEITRNIKSQGYYNPTDVSTITDAYYVGENGKAQTPEAGVVLRGFNAYYTIEGGSTNCILLYDGEEPVVEDTPDDPSRIDTFAKLKAITSDENVTFYIPAQTQVAFAKIGDGSSISSYLYLWDGNDGTYISGPDLYNKIFQNGELEVKQGQSVTGELNAMYFGGNNYNYFYYYTAYYPGYDNLTFGDSTAVTPKTISGEELIANIETKANDNSYIRIHGTFTPDGTFIADNGVSLDIQDRFDIGFDLAPYYGHMGYMTAITDKRTWTTPFSYALLPISTECFEDEGVAPATDVVYDAAVANEFTQEIPLANVTIENLPFTANKYSTICVPFNLNKDAIETVFGTGTKVFSPKGYGLSEGADTLKFNQTENIYAGAPYVILPTQEVSTPVFNGVTVKAQSAYNTRIWKDNWVNDLQKEIFLCGTYSPVELSSVTDAFCLSGEGYAVAPSEDDINGFRAYITIAGGSDRIILVMGRAVIIPPSTGIDELTAGQTRLDGKIYNINGQYVGDVLDGLQKGIYIQNGKKIIVK